jgi:hypothetical protein
VSNPLRHVVVLGGGSAGWLVAGLLAAEHGGANGPLRVTLIESSEAPPIGVGEGTWPSMRDTLRRIGIAEVDLIRECDASFKQGSRFDGWAGGPAAAAGDHYYHPFSLPTGHGEADLVGAWLAGPAGRPFADVVSPQPRVCAAGLAPKQTATPAYAAVANYAYHFDAGKFGQLLRRHAVEQLGVRHVVSHVEAVVGAPDGGIAALRSRSAGDIHGDLFIDCSGLPSLLIGQHFGVPLVEQRGVLFNDAALAMQVPYARPDAPLASCTLATAWSKGWIWDIGLPQRRGVGVVYASRHASQDEAAQALRHYLRATGAPRTTGDAAHRLHARLPGALLGQELRGHRPVQRLHRTAGGLGAGAGRAQRAVAQRDAARQLRRLADAGTPLQRRLQLPLGAGHRFPETALRAEPARRQRLLARAPRPGVVARVLA